jgi:hypothetical protein
MSVDCRPIYARKIFCHERPSRRKTRSTLSPSIAEPDHHGLLLRHVTQGAEHLVRAVVPHDLREQQHLHRLGIEAQLGMEVAQLVE